MEPVTMWISIMSLVNYVSRSLATHPLVQYENTSIGHTNQNYDTLVNFGIAQMSTTEGLIRERRSFRNKKLHEHQLEMHHIDDNKFEHYSQFTHCLFENYNFHKQTLKNCIKKREKRGIRDHYPCLDLFQTSVEKFFRQCRANECDGNDDHEGLQSLLAIWDLCLIQKQDDCNTEKSECHNNYKNLKFPWLYNKGKYFAKCDIKVDYCFLVLPEYCFKKVVKGISCYDRFPMKFGIDKGIPNRSNEESVPKKYKKTTWKDCRKIRKRLRAEHTDELPQNEDENIENNDEDEDNGEEQEH